MARVKSIQAMVYTVMHYKYKAGLHTGFFLEGRKFLPFLNYTFHTEICDICAPDLQGPVIKSVARERHSDSISDVCSESRDCSRNSSEAPGLTV